MEIIYSYGYSCNTLVSLTFEPLFTPLPVCDWVTYSLLYINTNKYILKNEFIVSLRGPSSYKGVLVLHSFAYPVKSLWKMHTFVKYKKKKTKKANEKFSDSQTYSLSGKLHYLPFK